MYVVIRMPSFISWFLKAENINLKLLETFYATANEANI